MRPVVRAAWLGGAAGTLALSASCACNPKGQHDGARQSGGGLSTPTVDGKSFVYSTSINAATGEPDPKAGGVLVVYEQNPGSSTYHQAFRRIDSEAAGRNASGEDCKCPHDPVVGTWVYLIGRWAIFPMRRAIAGAPGTAAIFQQTLNAAGEDVDRVIAVYDDAFNCNSTVWVIARPTAPGIGPNGPVTMTAEFGWIAYCDVRVSDGFITSPHHLNLAAPTISPDDAAAVSLARSVIDCSACLHANVSFPSAEAGDPPSQPPAATVQGR